jgi:hypothetical protein
MLPFDIIEGVRVEWQALDDLMSGNFKDNFKAAV